MKEIKNKLSIVMPAYNEENRIVFNIEETIRTVSNFGCPWELIVIDDCSTDNTYKILQQLSLKYPQQLIVKKIPMNLGKGRVLKKALHYVSGDYTVFIDADLDLHPFQIQTLFDIMRIDNADIVIGSKLHPNSKVKYPLQRKIMSMGYYYLVKLLFNLPCHDTQTGLKLFKTEVLRKVFPRILVKQFAFDLEVLVNAHHLGYHIAEAPIVLHSQREYARLGMNSVITTLWDTLAVFYRMHILKYYDRIDYHRRKNMAKEFRRVRK